MRGNRRPSGFRIFLKIVGFLIGVAILGFFIWLGYSIGQSMGLF